ncbi:hypothetical protein [Solidesulfovibrio sp.]
MSWKNKLFIPNWDEGHVIHKAYKSGKSIAAWEMLYRCDRDVSRIPKWVFDYLFDCADKLAEIEDVGKDGPRAVVQALLLNNLRNAFDDEDKGKDLFKLQYYAYDRYIDLKVVGRSDEDICADIAQEMNSGVVEDQKVRSILKIRGGITEDAVRSWVSKQKKFHQAMRDEEL